MMMGFHTGLGVTLRLGLFPLICITGWLLLLPPLAWEWLPDLPGSFPQQTGDPTPLCCRILFLQLLKRLWVIDVQT
jgi:hypothetical protein